MAQRTFKLSRRNTWLLALLTPCVLLAGSAGWLVTTTSGLQWLAGVIERRSGGSLGASGFSGSLLRSFGMQHLVLRGEGWRITLQGASLDWQPTVLLRGEVNVLHLAVQQVDVLALPSEQPVVLPETMRLPLDVSVLQLDIGVLRMYSREDGKPDLTASGIGARFVSDAQSHRLQRLHVKLPYGELDGSAQIGISKPFALTAHMTLDAPLQLAARPQVIRVAADAAGDLQQVAVQLAGSGGGMSFDGTAQLAPVSAIPVSGMQLRFDGLDARWLADGVPAAGLSGKVELHGTAGGGFEGALQVRNPHAAPLDKNGLPLLALDARLRLSAARLQVSQLDARFRNDGHIAGALVWRTREARGNARLKVKTLDPSVLDTRVPGMRLHGDIELESAGDEQRAVLALSEGQFQLGGNLRRRGKQVELSELHLVRGETELTGHGQMALDRRRTYRLVSQLKKLNLSEFADVPSTDINAALEVSGTLLPEAAGTLEFDLRNSRFAQYEIGGSGHFDFAGVRRIVGETVVRLGDNRLRVDVARGTAADHLRLLLEAEDLAQFGHGLGGKLTGQGDLSGTLDAPELNFSLGGEALDVSGQHVDRFSAAGSLSEQVMQVQLDVAGYHNASALNLPQARIELQGSRAQHTLDILARVAQDAAVLGELNLSAQGGFGDATQGWQLPQWKGTLQRLDASGVAPLHLLAPAPLSVAQDAISMGVADFSLSGGTLHFSDTQWTPTRWHSAGNFSGLNVRAVNGQRDKPTVGAADSMRFGGEWAVSKDGHWQGGLQVRRESGDWVVDSSTGMRLGLHDLRMSLRAEQDRLDVQLHASGTRLGEIALQAEAPLTQQENGAWTLAPDAPLGGHLHVRSDDLSWLGPLLDPNVQSGGRLRLDADLVGIVRTPRLIGEARGEELAVALLDQGVRLEQGQLEARFAQNELQLDRLFFVAPYQTVPRDTLLGGYKVAGAAGRLSANGALHLEDGSGDLQITADHLPVAQRKDRWVMVSGNGSARYADKTLMLGGNVVADAGMINQIPSDRPRWSDDVHIVGQQVAEPSPLSIAVDAKLDMGEKFYIRASGLEARLAGKLDVHALPGEALHVTGIIAAQDALFDAYGQRLQVERGMVNFQGPLDDPGLNIRALRKGLSVEAGVEVSGTVRHPVVQLVSTPAVPDAEKLSWIVLGRVPDAKGFDSGLLMSAAGSIMGGQSASQIGRAIGVDELSLKQKGDSGDLLDSQVVTVGKRLSSRLYLSYEQGFADAVGITKFTYTLTPRITLVTRTGTEDAIDLVYSVRFY